LKLIFTDQYAHIFFLLNGLAILFYLGAKKKKRQRAMKFGNYETLQKVAGKNFLKSSNILLVMKILALTSLIVGISQPVLEQEIPSTNSDYVLAVDASSGMLVSDIKPTRFKAAKTASKQFVDTLSNETDVGIVSFAGEVHRESGLTNNKPELKATVDDISTGTTAGTAIGDAIYASTSLLLGSNRSRTVILITDGRNNVGSSLNDSIEYAQTHNVTINTVGIGESNQSRQEFGIIQGENASRAQYPNLDTESLYRVSNQTGGELVTVSNETSLRNAFFQFEETTVETDISRYFIFLALFLILTEWTLGTTKYSILP